MPTSSERTDLAAGLRAFLGEHTPFQAMADDELDELAAESELVDFSPGAVVADYARRVPDDVWMVRSGQVTLQTSADGTTIDTVQRGGIFGYTPLLTGGRHGVRRVDHGAQHLDPVAGGAGSGTVRQTGPAWRSWPRRHGM